jgi:hypothetical protein
MANRTVAAAERNAGGCGYIVIGAEAGSVSGVTEIDPAALGQGVQPYLGSDGPSWGMAYVPAASKSVLVITVERPQPGDRIRTLQKYRPGAVFVRRPGQTIQAEPGDIRALKDRFAAPLRQAERDSKREQLEKIGDVLETVFEAVNDAQPNDGPRSSGPRRAIAWAFSWRAGRGRSCT